MADVLFYESGIQFDIDIDDPCFDSDQDQHSNCSEVNDSNVTCASFPSDCLSDMSCGMINSNGLCYQSNKWLLRNESNESQIYARLDSMMCHFDPDYYESVANEPASMTLEDIRSHLNSCNSCGVSWSDNHVSLDCKECGGYSLSRPCPLCDGRCKSQWSRDVSMSHAVGKAHWEGKCRLPTENSIPSFLAEDILIQGIQELSASS